MSMLLKLAELFSFSISKYKRKEVNLEQMVDKVSKYVQSSNPTNIIHFSALPKIGINPSSQYNTPIGVYGYPLTPQIFEQFKMGTLPFANTRPYVFLFSISGNILYTDKYSSINLQDDIAKIKNIVHGFDNYEIGLARRNSYRDTTISQFMNVTRVAANENPMKWNALFRRLGYDAMVDLGSSTIHKSEPTQAVIFNPRIINVIEMFHNSTIDELDFIEKHVSKHESDILKHKSEKRDTIRYQFEHLDNQKVISQLLNSNNSKIIEQMVRNRYLDKENRTKLFNILKDKAKYVGCFLIGEFIHYNRDNLFEGELYDILNYIIETNNYEVLEKFIRYYGISLSEQPNIFNYVIKMIIDNKIKFDGHEKYIIISNLFHYSSFSVDAKKNIMKNIINSLLKNKDNRTLELLVQGRPQDLPSQTIEWIFDYAQDAVDMSNGYEDTLFSAILFKIDSLPSKSIAYIYSKLTYDNRYTILEKLSLQKLPVEEIVKSLSDHDNIYLIFPIVAAASTKKYIIPMRILSKILNMGNEAVLDAILKAKTVPDVFPVQFLQSVLTIKGIDEDTKHRIRQYISFKLKGGTGK